MSYFVSINPSTGREIARTPALTPDALESAIARAQAEQVRWRSTPLRVRASLLSEIARQLELDAKDLAALMSREVGKPFREALAEIKKCAWTARHFAEHGPAMLGDEMVDTEARKSFVRHVPLGVILAIMPWNFPFWQVFRFALPAMLAGNTVLLKHAPSTMGCAAAIEAVMRKAGAARGLLQNLPIPVETTEALIADPRVAAVTLTGSTRAGRAVAAIAGAHLKPCVLELGGSDPFIVMPSADLEQAIDLAVRARVQNNGQSCIAAKRFFIHASVYPAFEKGMTDAMARLRCGDPMDESVDLGPLASEAARTRLQSQIEAAIAAGGRLLLGGTPPAGAGYFYPPTVIADLPHESPVVGEELFGPVALLFKVSSLDSALALANSTPYGLSSSIWTTDEAEAEAAMNALDVGSVFVNGMPRSDPRLPFGGVKASGYGRELGREGLLAFTSARTIWQK
jgi:succinate-semialdehyde dehydrogenase/glutarate-semialdehyde dehydrogenase